MGDTTKPCKAIAAREEENQHASLAGFCTEKGAGSRKTRPRRVCRGAIASALTKPGLAETFFGTHS